MVFGFGRGGGTPADEQTAGRTPSTSSYVFKSSAPRDAERYTRAKGPYFSDKVTPGYLWNGSVTGMGMKSPEGSTIIEDPIKLILTPQYMSLRMGAAKEYVERASKGEDLSEHFQAPIMDGRIMEGCAFRAVIAGVGGIGFGMAFGGFMHAMQPVDVDGTKSTMTAIRESAKSMRAACSRMSRGFAKVGVVFACVDCMLEQERAVHNVWNPVYAGCFTGAALAFQAGPTAMGLGCAGFAAFSVVIEQVMGH